MYCVREIRCGHLVNSRGVVAAADASGVVDAVVFEERADAQRYADTLTARGAKTRAHYREKGRDMSTLTYEVVAIGGAE